MTKPKSRPELLNPELQRRVLSIREAQHVTDLSQATIYRLIAACNLTTVKIDHALVVELHTMGVTIRR
jgi:hypothetical protein